MQQENSQILLMLQGVFVPVATHEKFAAATGVDIGIVKNWMQRGQIPTKKIGRYRLVDLAAMLMPAAAPSTRSGEARRAGSATKNQKAPPPNRGVIPIEPARAGGDE